MDTDRPRLCQHTPCGKPITPARTGRPPKYCSDSCRKRAWEAERLRQAVVVELARIAAAHQQRSNRPDETPIRPDETPAAPEPPPARTPRRGRTAEMIQQDGRWVIVPPQP
ncbi:MULTISPECIES: hypothetical protein [Streptomyces]|uniref:hypothetical protein n=1 Tax=Streptomyces TaxID=1883 RepID=UPI0033FF2311